MNLSKYRKPLRALLLLLATFLVAWGLIYGILQQEPIGYMRRLDQTARYEKMLDDSFQRMDKRCWALKDSFETAPSILSVKRMWHKKFQATLDSLVKIHSDYVDTEYHSVYPRNLKRIH